MKTAFGVFWKESIRWDKIENAVQASDGYRELYESAYNTRPDTGSTGSLPPESHQNVQGQQDDNASDSGRISTGADQPDRIDLDQSFYEQLDSMEVIAARLDVKLKQYHKLLAEQQRYDNVQVQRDDLQAIQNRARALKAEITSDMQNLLRSQRELFYIAKAPKEGGFQTVGKWMGETANLGKRVAPNLKSANAAAIAGNTKATYDLTKPLVQKPNPNAPAPTNEQKFFDTTAADAFKYMDMGLSSISAVLSMMSLVSTFASLIKGWKALPLKEKSLGLFNLLGSLTGATNDTYGAVSKIWNLTETAVKTGGASLTIASGGLDMLLGANKIIRAHASQTKVDDAKERFKTRMQGMPTNEEGRHEVSKDDLQYNKMTKMLSDKFATQSAEGGLDVLSGALKTAGGIISLCGIAAPIGAVISLAGFGVGLAKTIFSYVAKRKDRQRAVDNYLDTEKVVSGVKGVLSGRQLQLLGFDSEDKLREEVRIELMAKIHCHNIDGAYRYVTRQYANLLYRRAFFRKNGNAFTRNEMRRAWDDQANDEELKIAKGEYYTILQSLKFKPLDYYPEEADETPTLDAKTIAAKMMA